jgi:Uma2 family endonuclease
MSLEEYLAWASARPGRYELVDGRPVATPAETLGHIKVKHRVLEILEELVEASGLDLVAVGDGATVPTMPSKAREPDALIYRGPALPDTALVVPSPIIVVEVISPENEREGRGPKLVEYFVLPSVEHYLIVSPRERTVDHFRRASDGPPRCATYRPDESIALDPPGLILPVRRCFERK